MSGSEPLFTEAFFGTPRGISSYNCYAYAINEHRGTPGYKLQPGDKSRQSSDLDSSSCPVLVDRVMDDNKRRGIRPAKPGSKCPPGYYKIMSFQDPGKDYHFYRQGNHLVYRTRPRDTLKSIARDFRVPLASVVSPTPHPKAGELVFVKGAGAFSHKQGLATGPLLRDARGSTISDPRSASRNYGDLNYTTFCGAMCVRARGTNATPVETRKLHALLNTRAGRRVQRVQRVKRVKLASS